VPNVICDLASHSLRQAGVQGAAPAAGFQGAEVFEVNDSSPGGDGLICRPPRRRPSQGVVEVGTALVDPAGLLREDISFRIQRVLLVLANEPVMLGDLRVQTLALESQSVLLGQYPGSPVLRPGPQGRDRPILLQLGSACAQQRV